MTSCVITNAVLENGVWDVTAAVEGGGHPSEEHATDRTMRFRLPQKIIASLHQGQRCCYTTELVTKDSVHIAKDTAGLVTPPIVVRGVIMRYDAKALLLSVGGLPLRLPRDSVGNETITMGDVIRVSLQLTAATASNKRSGNDASSQGTPNDDSVESAGRVGTRSSQRNVKTNPAQRPRRR